MRGIHIGIEDGKIRAIVIVGGEHRTVATRAATRDGAVDLGRALVTSGLQFDHLLYSSSTDFPEEYGGEKINYRDAIAQGIRMAFQAKDGTPPDQKEKGGQPC